MMVPSEYLFEVRGRLRAPTLPSTALFGALVSAYDELFGDARGWLEEWLGGGEPPFAVSSMFPRYGETLFWPKPLGLVTELPKTDAAKGRQKEFKRIAYISTGILEDYLEGRLTPEGFAERFLAGAFAVCGPAVARKEEMGPEPPQAFFASAMFVHNRRSALVLGGEEDEDLVAVRRFEVRTWTYLPKAGLFFRAEVREDFVDRFTALLRHICDTGVGGDRSTGCGQLRWLDGKAPSLREKSGWRRGVSLSLWYPTEEETRRLADGASRYEVVRLRLKASGRGEEQVWKPSLCFLKEGADVDFRPGAVAGRCLALSGGIVQYGQTVVLGGRP